MQNLHLELNIDLGELEGHIAEALIERTSETDDFTFETVKEIAKSLEYEFANTIFSCYKESEQIICDHKADIEFINEITNCMTTYGLSTNVSSNTILEQAKKYRQHSINIETIINRLIQRGSVKEDNCTWLITNNATDKVIVTVDKKYSELVLTKHNLVKQIIDTEVIVLPYTP